MNQASPNSPSTEGAQGKKLWGLRLTSTPASVNSGEPTWLAIFEFCIAIAVAAYCIFHELLLHYLIGGTLVAPLFLLRTPQSTKEGFQRLGAIVKRLSKYQKEVVDFGMPVPMWPTLGMNTYIVLSALWIRLTVALRTFALHPSESISVIPANWFRQVLCLDSAHPPELMPEVETNASATSSGLSSITYSKVTEDLGALVEGIGRPFFLFQVNFGFLLLVYAIFYLPPVLFRLAFKFSSFAWIPLIWCVSPFRPTSASGLQKLEDLRYGVVDKLALSWSTLVIALFVVELHLSARSSSLFAEYAPSLVLEVHRWQLAGFVSACFAWGMFIFADIQLRALGRGRGLPNRSLLSTINASMLIRRTLAVYTLLNATPLLSAEIRLLVNARLSDHWFSF